MTSGVSLSKTGSGFGLTSFFAVVFFAVDLEDAFAFDSVLVAFLFTECDCCDFDVVFSVFFVDFFSARVVLLFSFLNMPSKSIF